MVLAFLTSIVVPLEPMTASVPPVIVNTEVVPASVKSALGRYRASTVPETIADPS